jgi:hypothetical protein
MNASGQGRFDFGEHAKRKVAEVQWPQIIAADPAKYSSRLMQQMAAMGLHRSGLIHRSELCILCERDARRERAA